MSHTTTASPSGHSENHDGHHTNYVKIWAILLGLLVVSVVGPMFGVRIVTLVTAFGIAIVKASMVVKHFMHINLERKWVGWLLVTMLVLMGVMLGGVSPDVMQHEGQTWQNAAAKAVVDKGMAEAPAEHGEHTEAHH